VGGRLVEKHLSSRLSEKRNKKKRGAGVREKAASYQKAYEKGRVKKPDRGRKKCQQTSQDEGKEKEGSSSFTRRRR